MCRQYYLLYAHRCVLHHPAALDIAPLRSSVFSFSSSLALSLLTLSVSLTHTVSYIHTTHANILWHIWWWSRVIFGCGMTGFLHCSQSCVIPSFVTCSRYKRVFNTLSIVFVFLFCWVPKNMSLFLIMLNAGARTCNARSRTKRSRWESFDHQGRCPRRWMEENLQGNLSSQGLCNKPTATVTVEFSVWRAQHTLWVMY